MNIIKRTLIRILDFLYLLYSRLRIKYVDFRVKSSPQHRKIKRYKGIHEGEKCFIIGNGPSLKAIDLDRINIPSFSSNRIGIILDRANWVPYYYSTMDLVMWEENISEVYAINSRAKFFVSLELDGNYKYIKRYKGDFIWLWSRNVLDEKGMPEFSVDLDEKVNRYGTVSYINIQLAVYMGFKEIYLLGLDNSYAKEKNSDGVVKVNEQMNGRSYFGGYDAKCSDRSFF